MSGSTSGILEGKRGVLRWEQGGEKGLRLRRRVNEQRKTGAGEVDGGQVLTHSASTLRNSKIILGWGGDGGCSRGEFRERISA